jgi:hypothetical protein
MKTVPKTDKEPIKTQYSASKRLVKGKAMSKAVRDESMENEMPQSMPMSKTAKKKSMKKKIWKVKKGGKKKG